MTQHIAHHSARHPLTARAAFLAMAAFQLARTCFARLTLQAQLSRLSETHPDLARDMDLEERAAAADLIINRPQPAMQAIADDMLRRG